MLRFHEPHIKHSARHPENPEKNVEQMQNLALLKITLKALRRRPPVLNLREKRFCEFWYKLLVEEQEMETWNSN